MANYPYQNPALSIDERVDDLMSRMSTAEKVKQITCAMVIPITPLEKHLGVTDSEEDRELYRLLSRRLVRLAKEKHPERDYTELEVFLKG